MAKDVEEADPLSSGAATVVLIAGAETGSGEVSFFPVKSLVTYSRNPPS